MPAPPAMRRMLPRLARSAVKWPNGPSAKTRGPGLSAASRLEWSPSVPTVIRRRNGGHRVRVRRAQVPPRDETEQQEVARPHAQPVDVGAGEPDAVEAVPLGDDGGDAHPALPGVHRGEDEPPGQHSGRGAEVERDPEHAVERVRHEMRAGAQLVQEGEEDRDVGGDMQPVPDLVRQLRPDQAGAAQPDRQEREGADERGEHVGVGVVDVPELVPRRGLVDHFRPEHDEDDVHDDEEDDGCAERPVPGHELVESDRVLEPRDARDQQHLVADQQGADHPAQLTDRGDRVRRGGGEVRRHAGPPHPEHHDDARHEHDAHRARTAPVSHRGAATRSPRGVRGRGRRGGPGLCHDSNDAGRIFVHSYVG